MKWIAITLGIGLCLALGVQGQELKRPLRSLDSNDFHMEVPASAKAWDQRRTEIRQRVMLAAGLWPMPERTPLNAVIHGRVERDDYTIDRVFFESFPGHFVTGSLYRPTAASGSMPGILCPHGHWKNGRMMDASTEVGHRRVAAQLASGAERFESAARSPLQARCVQLARMGCVVFHYDTLGNADSVQISDHRSGARDDLKGRLPGEYGLYSTAAELRLQTNFGLQTYNSVRALDFLESLPQVDSSRLGVTGASGGATQTMMVTAVDDRVAAAFPCVMVSTSMQGGCTCENAPYLRIGQGNVDIAAATVPRPLGLTSADDWTIELESKGFPELHQLYKLVGKPSNLTGHFATHFTHNYNHVSRIQMYGFFNRHFGLGLDEEEPVLERDFQFSSPDELTVWTDDHPRPSGDEAGDAHEKSLLKVWAELSDSVVSPLLAPSNEEELEAMQEVVGKAWGLIVGRSYAELEPSPLVVSKTWEENGVSWVSGEATASPFPESVPIKMATPSDWSGRAVVLTSMNEFKADVADALLADGYLVLAPDLYLRGADRNPSVNEDAESAPNSWKAAACYTYGYNPSLFAHRVRDVMTCVSVLRSTLGGRLTHLTVLGHQGAGVVAATAVGQMRGHVDHLALDTEGFRFGDLDSIWDADFVPGAVKYGDVPALLSLCAPVEMSILGEAIDNAGFHDAYRAVGAGGKVRAVAHTEIWKCLTD